MPYWDKELGMPTISFIIPSINRETLHRTINSIELLKGDEIIVEFDIPKSNMWGNPQRNKGMARATTDYLAFIDDDDYYVPGHRQIMENAINENPQKPNLFKMKYPNGFTLWDNKEVVPGNIGSPMIFVPNIKKMLYHWKDWRNMADFLFVDNWKWPKKEIVWREEVIALLGHNDEELQTALLARKKQALSGEAVQGN